MQVFLVHAAESEADARALAFRLRWHDCQPTHVWTSPTADAQRTARIITTVIECELPLEQSAALAEVVDEDENVAGFARTIRRLPKLSVVLLVAHEPVLSELAELLGGAPPNVRPLPMAAAARIVDGAIRWRVAHDSEATTPAHRSLLK